MTTAEDPRGKYEGDPCPNCGHPRGLGKLCFQCHAQVVRGVSHGSDCPTREMPVIPRSRRGGRHVCIVSSRGPNLCGHCDTPFTCPNPRCGHKGMQTKDCKPPYFILRCPDCGQEAKIHWIEYDLVCPRCGHEGAFGTYSRLLEPIIQCPDCGVSPRDEAA